MLIKNVARRVRRTGHPAPPTAALILLLGVAVCNYAMPATADAQDYMDLSLEDLMNLEIVSVSKRPEQMNDAAAAVHVITAETIRRSGATSIPEILRLVPGMQVAQIDANKWAVTSRGFNNLFANKLLVLVDGRSAYEPIFSGVFWKSIGVSLADVERIEVIRGPGATMWGANAMNGVINIITKRAGDTQGIQASEAVGTELILLGSIRYGGGLGPDVAYRGTAEYVKRGDFLDAAGEDAGDGWDLAQVTARLDWDVSATDQLTVTGHYFDAATPSSYFKPLLTPPYTQTLESTFETTTRSAQVHWAHAFSGSASLDAQIFYNGLSVTDSLAVVDEDMLDIELRHSLQIGESHSLVWGGGYRVIWDDIQPGLAVFDPSTRRYDLGNVFCQDSWDLAPDRLRLTLGAKWESFDGDSGELQPNVRVAWTPAPTQTIWGAVSRAVRTPSRYENSVSFNTVAIPPGVPGNEGPLTVLMQARGVSDLPVEDMRAYELGYRIMPSHNVSCDLALFYHDYEDLRSMRTGAPETVMGPIPYVVIPLSLDNQIAGHTWGAELSVDWLVSDDWRLQATATHFDDDLELLAGVEEISASYLQMGSSRDRLSLWSKANLPRNFELDLWLRYSSKIDDLDIDDLWGLDARLGWRVADSLDLSIVGQNLLSPESQEYTDAFISTRPAWIQRGVYGKATVWF